MCTCQKNKGISLKRFLLAMYGKYEQQNK
jgi:hypothetical protein